MAGDLNYRRIHEKDFLVCEDCDVAWSIDLGGMPFEAATKIRHIKNGCKRCNEGDYITLPPELSDHGEGERQP